MEFGRQFPQENLGEGLCWNRTSPLGTLEVIHARRELVGAGCLNSHTNIDPVTTP